MWFFLFSGTENTIAHATCDLFPEHRKAESPFFHTFRLYHNSQGTENRQPAPRLHRVSEDGPRRIFSFCSFWSPSFVNDVTGPVARERLDWIASSKTPRKDGGSGDGLARIKGSVPFCLLPCKARLCEDVIIRGNPESCLAMP